MLCEKNHHPIRLNQALQFLWWLHQFYDELLYVNCSPNEQNVPRFKGKNKFICAQIMIIAQPLRLIVLHCISVFELCIKAEVNNWWNVGFCLSSLTARTIDQSEASEAPHWPIRGCLNPSASQPIDQFDVQMLVGWIRPSWVRSTSRHGSLSRKQRWLRKHYSDSVNKSSVNFYLGHLCLVTLLPYWDASNLC